MFTKEEISKGYESLIWAQGLIDFVLRAGIDIDAERTAETEGSLISIFYILKNNLKDVEPIMGDLDMGYKDRFSAIWKNEKTEGGAE